MRTLGTADLIFRSRLGDQPRDKMDSKGDQVNTWATHHQAKLPKRLRREECNRWCCGERVAGTNLVCGSTYATRCALVRHIKDKHQWPEGASLRCVEGHVTIAAQAAMNIREQSLNLNTTPTQSEEAEEHGATAIEDIHRSEGRNNFWEIVMGKRSDGSSDFWKTVMCERTRLPDSAPNKRTVEDEAVDKHVVKRRRIDSPPKKAEPQEPEACQHRQPIKPLRELIAEAILSHPDNQMYRTEIIQFFRTHYPYYDQPSRKVLVSTVIDRALETGRKSWERFEQHQGRWRVTASYRRELEKAESKPVLTGFLVYSSATKK